MALTKRENSNTVYLQAKHFSLWREIKKEEPGCESVEVTNPRSGETFTKYGYRFDTVSGLAEKLVKYDTGQQYATRYFGFKLHLIDGHDRYVLDMPYQSEMLRRFLRVAPCIDWTKPFSITVFKGKGKKEGDEKTGIWFQQAGETVKPHFSREEPHGMPEATYDNDLQQWDFKAQHRWLIEKLKEEVIPAIDAAASARVPVTASVPNPKDYGIDEATETIPPHPDHITDDDVPF